MRNGTSGPLKITNRRPIEAIIEPRRHYKLSRRPKTQDTLILGLAVRQEHKTTEEGNGFAAHVAVSLVPIKASAPYYQYQMLVEHVPGLTRRALSTVPSKSWFLREAGMMKGKSICIARYSTCSRILPRI